MTGLRIATRASRLAIAQARWVADRLTATHPGLEVSLIEIDTTGDLDRISPVATLTEVGAFVRSVQYAVLDGRADVAVHSCKDLPVQGPEGLGLFFPDRKAPWDVLCGRTLAELSAGARVGTGSPRRTAQLRLLRPDLDIVEIRGNVDTRLAKVGSGEYEAVVLAEAGLHRIGRLDAIAQRFDLTEMVPAPAQAVLAVETVQDGEAGHLVAAIDDPMTRRAVETERLVLEWTGAGCRSALGALARCDDGAISVSGFVSDDAGPRRAEAVGHSPSEAAAAIIRELRL
jgi:hydroxymethylbilane synthase